MCFLDLCKAFDNVPRKVFEWTMFKNEIPKVFITLVMCLHEGARIRVRVDSELAEEFEVKVKLHQGSIHFLQLW